ncbi:hypothetical protein G3T36_13030 [Diaminobutyricibacter tongyongensis]|uniref:Uncharacterized protein n=1 Tax=Leifsonia tongyongensis TaxID=1268043 RepID=A0A6L9XZB8_9MICO|nr:hypothetical protein [Diaminobutyricibacter tongyongensis]NEN06789.1 hypothetical protein [Diaminobutyricibacter tongyongensis]
MSEERPAPQVPEGAGSAAALRAQLLATEHWSLLASRSTTQSEVLTRISILLTLASAALVSVALVGQATKFSGTFSIFANILLGVLVLVGVLTQLRVMNVSMEDLMYVLAMNRLRAAYADLAPGVESSFMTSLNDDLAGSRETYYFLGRRGVTQVLGSSLVFVVVVNATFVGLLVASLIVTAGASFVAGVISGAVVGVVYAVVSMLISGRIYFRLWKTYVPRRPTPGS